jgi:hypothetical protein
MRYCRTNELGSALNELEQVKGALAANATESQNLVAKQHEYSRLLTEMRQTVSTLNGERERLAAQIAELSDEKNGMSKSLLETSLLSLLVLPDLNARLESMNNEMEEHMENVREAQKAKTSAQRKLEKLERKLKALTVSAPASAPVVESQPIAPIPRATPSNKVRHDAPPLDRLQQDTAPLSGRKRARETGQTAPTITPSPVFAPSPFERARSPVKALPGGRTAFTPNRTPNRQLLHPTDENNLGSKPSVFTPKMRILSDPAAYTKTTPSTLGEEKLATLRTKLADMRTLNIQ